MTDVEPFALVVLLAAGVGLIAVLSSWLTERVRIPSPALVLVGAAIAVKVIPAPHGPPRQAVERIVTVALVCILFDGGLHIGWSRFRSAAGPIAVAGVAGTALTVAAGAVLLHLAFGLAWYVLVLVGTAVAPTDPAVVFSVLGQREVSGRAGTILEGEAGANDPVGIALMASLIGAGALSAGRSPRWAASSCCRWAWVRSSAWPAAGRCCGSCGGYRCPARACTRCAPELGHDLALSEPSARWPVLSSFAKAEVVH